MAVLTRSQLRTHRGFIAPPAPVMFSREQFGRVLRRVLSETPSQ